MLSHVPLPDPVGSVLSSHHQAVDDASLPHELPVLSRARDGIAEAVGHRSLPVLGVQWHPEHSGAPAQHMDSLIASLTRS